MSQRSPSEVSQLLAAWSAGEEKALDELMPLVYEELRALAAHQLKRERRGHTLQTTALVNEAYLKLVRQEGAGWESRSQFFSIAARVMRRVLVDHARRRLTHKRGGDGARVPIEKVNLAVQPDVDLLELEEGLLRLERLDPQQARVVELRVFAGCTVDETGEALGISASTVARDWRAAKIWLRAELAGG